MKNINDGLLNTSQYLAKQLKLLRKEQGLTQKQLAKLLNVSLYSIKKLEKGEIPKKLSVNILMDIHYNFGITPSQMLNL